MAKKEAINTKQKLLLWGTCAFVAVCVLLILMGVNTITTDHEQENPGILQTIEGFQDKVPQQDGTTRISFDSSNPDRPNMYIAQEETDKILFERSVISQDGKPITLTEYLAAYGEAGKMITGTAYYGKETNLYIYGSKGIAFIANPKNDKVLELHTFPVMSDDEYLQKYYKEN